MPFNLCQERNAIQNKVNLALSALSEKSRRAHLLCSEKGAEAQAAFAALRQEHALLQERVTTLKECLELHKEWHGC